jgi:hypothetical protein
MNDKRGKKMLGVNSISTNVVGKRLVDLLRPGWMNSCMPSNAGKISNARG